MRATCPFTSEVLLRALHPNLSVPGGIVTRVVSRRFRHAAWTGAMLAAAVALAPPAHAQEQRITGRVIDATEHTPIPSGTVVVTGTTIGANTSDSGTFTIHVPPSAHTFTVRRIGYLAQTVTIDPGKNDYTVALQKDVLRLEAQVVTGVATTVSTQNAANAVATVASSEVAEVPAPTVENAIQGQGTRRHHRAEQRRRTWRRHAGADSRHHVDQFDCRAALHRRRRHGQQRDDQQWRTGLDAARRAATGPIRRTTTRIASPTSIRTTSRASRS